MCECISTDNMVGRQAPVVDVESILNKAELVNRRTQAAKYSHFHRKVENPKVRISTACVLNQGSVSIFK